MHFTVLRENFLKSAALVGQAINQRPNLPVLGNFLFEVGPNKLSITATDLQTTIKATLPVKSVKTGRTTVPARMLIDFCQGAPTEKIECRKEKDSFIVVSGSARATIPTINEEEFPSTGEFQAATKFTMSTKKFAESVAHTIICAAPEDGRPILTGVLFESVGKKLNMVATDGYRLARKELNSEEQMQVVIPARALREAAKAAAEQEDSDLKISINKENNQVWIEMDNFSLFSRLLDGSYPNYEQIIPTSFVAEVQVSTKELIDAIKLTALFARDVGSVVKLSVGPKEIVVNASTAQIGEAQTSIPAQCKGDKVQIAFNSRFLLDLLGALKSKETTLFLSGLTSAALIKGLDENDLIYIVMPVRTQG